MTPAPSESGSSLAKLAKGILGITLTFTMLMAGLAVVSVMFSSSDTEGSPTESTTSAIGWQDNTDAILAAFPEIKNHPDFVDWETVADVLRHFPNDQESIPGPDSNEMHYQKDGPPRNFDRVRTEAASMASLLEKYRETRMMENLLKRIDQWGSKPRVDTRSMWLQLERDWRYAFESILFRITATLHAPGGHSGMTVSSINSVLKDVGLPALTHDKRTGIPYEPAGAEQWKSKLVGSGLPLGIAEFSVSALTSRDGSVLRLSVSAKSSESSEAAGVRLQASSNEKARLDAALILALSGDGGETLQHIWSRLDDEIAGQVSNVFSTLEGMTPGTFTSEYLGDEHYSCVFLKDLETSSGILNGMGTPDFGLLSFWFVSKGFNDTRTKFEDLQDGFSTE